MRQPPYLYRAKLVEVIDGDSLRLAVDCGFHVTITERFRMYGINAPEMRGDTKAMGQAARTALVTMLPIGEWFTIKTHRGQDKYGRWLVEISDGDETRTVNDRMVREGFAIPYMVN